MKNKFLNNKFLFILLVFLLSTFIFTNTVNHSKEKLYIENNTLLTTPSCYMYAYFNIVGIIYGIF